MKSARAPVLAAALVAFLHTPAFGVKLGSSPQLHLRPASFAESQSEAEATQTIQNALSLLGDEEGGVHREIMKAVTPALKSLFHATAVSIRPQIEEECKRIVEDFAKHEQQHEEEEGDEDRGSRYPEDCTAVACVRVWVAVFNPDDFSFSEQQQQTSQQQQQQQQQQQEVQFWDSLKKHLGSVARMASPLIQKVAEKFGPEIAKLGKKAAPVFAHSIRLLLRDACTDAEAKAGVEAQAD
ncbi:hypothetical protein, conserved [Eimeria tenella]|uniref:Uncharacterized protein n=1 Tax=Eimeria tenella TaxID=5802 RepID=U6L1N2_EIMTE|nr:hypothetical protein, conserved [Eimeria tenella]CDJ44086.1 hypothetical protein, conserved [Eimeria tenella]|eukprot:XP_013234835.1 hypothetical protein, conserved [Eimeria tenella]